MDTRSGSPLYGAECDYGVATCQLITLMRFSSCVNSNTRLRSSSRIRVATTNYGRSSQFCLIKGRFRGPGVFGAESNTMDCRTV